MKKLSYQEMLLEVEKDKEATFAELAEMQRKHSNLKQKLDEFQRFIRYLQEKIENENSEDSENNNQAAEEQQPLSVFIDGIEYTPERQSDITLGNGGERILEQANDSLHLSVLVEELRKLGRFTDDTKLKDVLRVDARKRFIHLGKGVWDLRSRHTQPKEVGGSFGKRIVLK